MLIQRILSALVLILAAATGALLLRPDLFPEITLPAFLIAAPQHRTMFGLIVSGSTAAVLLGLVMAALRSRYEADYPD